MVKLRVPSLQHMARNWHGDPQKVRRVLVRLAQNPPIMSYDPLFGAVRDMLVFGYPYDEIAKAVMRIRRPDIRAKLLEVLPLIRDHFRGVAPAFVQAVESRYYPVGRGLMVPFRPPLLYGVGGGLVFPWFSFWRANPIAGRSLSLFVSVVQDVLLQDPDLENAKFEILDFSAPAPKEPRVLTVTDARDVPRISAAELTDMLEVFAEGFFMAQAELAGTMPPPTEPPAADPDEPDLFDPDR